MHMERMDTGSGALRKMHPVFMSSRVFIFDESTLLHKRSEKSILKKDLNGVLETGGASGRD